MHYVHISLTTRERDNDRGGVPLFGFLLQKAIGCGVYRTSEVPILLVENIITKDTICIVDGYNGLGSIPSHIKIVSMVHGLWKEFAIRNDKVKDFALEVERQHKMWTTRPNTYLVASSPSAAKYLKIHHGVDPHKIVLHGIDTDLFKPMKKRNEKPVVLHAATDYNKDGHGRLGKIAELCKRDFDFRFLGAEIGEEHEKFAQGDIFIQGSFYEGNSFASLEALSCGLPVVASRAGLFEDYEFDMPVGEVVDWDAPAEKFVEMVYKVWDNYKGYCPREWMLKHCTFERFEKDWTEFLEGLI